MNLETMRAIVAKADNPDVEIQWLNSDGKWVDDKDGDDYDCMIRYVNDGYKYRIKPNTITLNGRELPKPIHVCKNICLQTRVMNNIKVCIDGFQMYEFKTQKDAQAWVDALNELMGDGK